MPLSNSYCLLLRNGQSIQISEAAPREDEIGFVASTRLSVPQVAWLHRSSDGSTLEVRVTDIAPDDRGVWRYIARLEAPEHVAKGAAPKRRWSFRREA